LICIDKSKPPPPWEATAVLAKGPNKRWGGHPILRSGGA
jgi:hypothetical protein